MSVPLSSMLGTCFPPLVFLKYRRLLRQRGIRPLISRRGTRDNNQPVSWVVEQTLALLHQFRRLAERWERRTDIHHGFLTLATSIICWPEPVDDVVGRPDPDRCAAHSTPFESGAPRHVRHLGSCCGFGRLRRAVSYLVSPSGRR
ncbi:hypothetical protein [Actinophytocola gossypii]|uniref:Transposase DDE domain-containing protein n=1 Tax=Actinophytocola gossypii TaxID=2812003 RepID=A0ABT2J201_9PSEU|nr:hypothetical protein [Actinophytocola gossypii]